MLNRNIALQCHDCAGQPETVESQPSPTGILHPDLRTGAVQAKLVRKLQRVRSRRTDFLSSTLFGEPAWDMLLELFVSAVEQKRVTVGALCIASNVPPTTALRWIDVLLRENLATRRSDPLDGRRIYVEISPAAYRAMQQYAEQLSDTIRPA